MKTRKKKLFASALSVLLVLAMVLGNIGTVQAQADVTNTETDKPTKTAAWVTGEEENTAEVTIQYKAKADYKTVTSYTEADIVLVIDTSGSMGYDEKGNETNIATENQRITKAKAAAKNFVESILDSTGKVRIAVVSYAGTASTKIGLTAYSGKADILTAIDSLSADGGTNIQAGIKTAEDILYPTTTNNHQKYIIVLSDGEPTYSYKATAFDSTKTTLFYGTDGTDKYSKSVKLLSEFTYTTKILWNTVDASIGLGYSYSLDYQSYTLTQGRGKNEKSLTVSDNGLPTISEAYLAKNKGATIFSIQYANDGAAATYVMKNIASTYTETDAAGVTTTSARYYAPDVDFPISTVFAMISSEVTNMITTKAIVTDTVPAYFSVVANSEVVKVAGTAETSPSVVLTGNTDGTTTIVWTESSFDDTESIYTLKYQIKLDKTKLTASDYKAGGTVATNAGAKLVWQSGTTETQVCTFTDPTLPLKSYAYSVITRIEQADGTYKEATVKEGYAFKGDRVDYTVAAATTGYTSDKTVGNYSLTISSTETNADANKVVITYNLQEFTVRFFDDTAANSGTQIGSDQTVKYNQSATAPADPTKEGHKFNGWDKAYNNITANTDVYATYNINQYTVTYNVKVDGTLVETSSETVDWNTSLASLTKPDYTLKKPGNTAEKTYTAYDWRYEDGTAIKTDAKVTNNIIMEAGYTSEINTYTVIFNKTTIKADGSKSTAEITRIPVKYNDVVPTGSVPTVTKTTDDNKYSYSLGNWDGDVAKGITGDTTFTITETENYITYEVTFKFTNAEGIEETNTTTTTYEGTVDPPTLKASEDTAEWDYTLYSWPQAAYEKITENVTFTASETKTKKSYTYKFTVSYNYTGIASVITTDNVPYGTIITAPSIEEKAVSGQSITYRKAWTEGEQIEVTGAIDLTSYADYDTNKYTVKFVLKKYDENGTLYSTKTDTKSGIAYGTNLSKELPTDSDMEADSDNAQYDYSLSEWVGDYTDITDNVTITKEQTRIVKSYTVTFVYDVVENGEIVNKKSEVVVPYGSAATAPALQNVSALDNAQYKYTAAAWDKAFNRVTEDITVTASLSRDVKTYTVSFYIKDGETTTLIEAYENQPYGTKITKPAIPEKDKTVEYNYSIANGWTAEEEYAIIGDAEFIASYEAVKNNYTINFIVIDPDSEKGSYILKSGTVAYGKEVSSPDVKVPQDTDQYHYELTDFDEKYTVTKDIDVYATIKKNTKRYTVTFMNEDGKEQLHTATVDYGTILTSVANDVTIPETISTVYTFEGWRTEADGKGTEVQFVDENGKYIYTVKKDQTVYASISEKTKTYTITYYVNEEESGSDEIYVKDEKPQIITVTGGDAYEVLTSGPVKKSVTIGNSTTTYKFNGWTLGGNNTDVIISFEAVDQNYKFYPTYTEKTEVTPTEAPTATPTEAPTATPTEAPTATPTEALIPSLPPVITETPVATTYRVTYVLTDETGDSLSLTTPAGGYYAEGAFTSVAEEPTVDASKYVFSGWSTTDTVIVEIAGMNFFTMPGQNITIYGTVSAIAVPTEVPTTTPTPEPTATPTPVEEIIEEPEIPEAPVEVPEEELPEEELPLDLPETGTISVTMVYLFAAAFVIAGLAINRKRRRA